MDDEEQETLDESFRAVAVGYAMLDEAVQNPAFRRWFEGFLDCRLTRDADRVLFDFLCDRAPNDNVVSFSVMAPPGKTE